MTTFTLFGTDPVTSPNPQDAGAVNLGTAFDCEAAAWILGIRHMQPEFTFGNVLPAHSCAIYNTVTGTAVFGPVTMPVPVAGEWCEYTLPTPFALTPGTRYTVVVFYPGGDYVATSGYFTTGVGATNRTVGPIVLPNAANSVGSMQGSFKYSPSIAKTDGTFGGSNYYSDIRFTDVNPSGGGLTVLPTGIASGVALGAASVALKVTALPTGISTGAALGASAVALKISALPTGISSGEALGTVGSATSLQVSTLGISSGEALGSPSASAPLSAVVASPVGITTAVALGTPAALTALTASVTGILTGTALGAPAALTALTVTSVGIPSGTALGAPVATSGIAVQLAGISSSAFVEDVTVNSVLVATMPGIVTGMSFGTVKSNTEILVLTAGIPSEVRFGDVGVLGLLNSQLAGISTGFGFGTTQVQTSLFSYPVGIPTGVAFGSPTNPHANEIHNSVVFAMLGSRNKSGSLSPRKWKGAL